MLKALLEDYADLIKSHEDKEELLNVAREALRAHDPTTDGLNKRWYRAVKTGTELSRALATALEGIPTKAAPRRRGRSPPGRRSRRRNAKAHRAPRLLDESLALDVGR